MAYVENRTVHDADSHVMELPGTIERYLEQRFVKRFQSKNRLSREQIRWADQANQLQDDQAFRSGDAANILLRKNHEALGSFRRDDRPMAMDLLGFTSQLVFTTSALSNYGLEHNGETDLAIATANAHNRMMVDFCEVDPRLLPTGYVPLVSIEQAPKIAAQAIELGCKALVIPSICPTDHSPSHVGFDPLWAVAQEAGIPILFHVGGEEKMVPAYAQNGLPPVKDFHGEMKISPLPVS